ncbi:hypothetical protein HRI_000808400 [Hibiscus trionum]|uniref:RING-CH-type domain-containing protein n=1 Tax=Hibiscus trionum TaxID=183268 RepID=A0A9W7LPK4_HIBTR|nr:hypothetical protein HRI_000808400 [Hibiscus trionum]
MASLEMSHVDLEQGTHRRNGSDVSADEVSVCFSDADEGSCYSQFYSTTGGSHDDYCLACGSDGEIGDVSGSGRVSSASDCSVEVRIQSGANEIKVHLAKVEKDCRICHLGLESNSHESGVAIELGCSCKDDLAAAHKHCAEAWFKIRGNKTCEICNSTARNVVGVDGATKLRPAVLLQQLQ